jgi:hypothetical protein
VFTSLILPNLTKPKCTKIYHAFFLFEKNKKEH